jgi:dienelactone hydrolase
VSRRDLSFASGGEECAAWLYLPDNAGGRLPCVVMAHVFGGVRSAQLGAHAERFAAAGFAVLVFDYRHFGASGGEPRQLLDIGRQQDDWRAAVGFARSLPEVDPEQVVVWGTSFSGGHVMVIAAEDDRLAAAISQTPYVSGPSALRAAGPRNVMRMTRAGLRDEAARLRGREPVTLPIAGPPGTVGAMTSPDAEPGYRATFRPDDGWVNAVIARVVLRVGLYSPARVADRIACPWLVQVVENDAVTPAGPTIAAAARAPWAQLLRYPGGHFDVYGGELHERFVDDQLAFLRRVVQPLPVGAA